MISCFQRKCDQYWPERGTKSHGQIQVTLKETLNMSHYTLRKFIITHKQVGKNYLGTSFPFVLGVACHLSFLRPPWDFYRSDFKTPQTLIWRSGLYFRCRHRLCTNLHVTLYGLWLEKEVRVETKIAKPLTSITIKAYSPKAVETGLLEISSVKCIFWDRTILLQVGVSSASLSPSNLSLQTVKCVVYC